MKDTEERRYSAEVKFSDWGEGKGGGNHTWIIHLLQEADSPGNDVALLIVPSHVAPIHSTENAANGSMPGFVCLFMCVKVYVQQ